MSVRLQTLGATQLEAGTPAVKRNFTTVASIGGASGQVCGGYLGAFIRLPASFTTAENQQAIIFGADSDRDGVVNEANESGLVIGGPASATAPRRPRWRFGTANVNSENMPQMTLDRTHLVLTGLTNRGTNASPAWIQWIAYCDTVTGDAHSFTVAHNATLLTSTTQSVLATLFMAAGVQPSRTPVNIELEQVAWVDGDFPWDTANAGSVTGSVAGQGRPHHDAIRALCGFGGTHNWATLAAAQNAGTLGYANLRSNGDTPARPGRATVTEWFKLANLADLANYGSNSSNALVVVNYNSLSNGLVSGSAPIAPAHWNPGPAVPTIDTPRRLFTAGRGLLPTVRTGSYDAMNTTALQRRWVFGANPVNEGATAGVVVPGFDWSAAGITLNAGSYSCTTLLPRGGPYTLQVRDANAPAVISSPQTDTMVGMRVLMHGPSSMALSIRGFNDTALGPNLLNVAAAPGVLAQVMRLDNMLANGGSGGSYAPPQAVVGTIRGGETPAIGHGAILLANEWFVHNPREPIDLCNMAINTHGMDLWVSNAANPAGDPTWRFLGPLTLAPPGPANGNASGVVNYYAWLLNQSNGVDLHVLMWFGGISATTGAAGDLVGSGTGRMGYRAAIDARFPASPNAPWVIFPSWRIHRSAPDTNAGPTPRNDHVLMVEELNAVAAGRGILGPTWNDIISDGNNSAHPAFNTSNGVPSAGNYVSDANQVGQGRLGPSLARCAAWAFDRRVKARGPRLVRAWYADGTRNAIVLELGRQCRTLGGAALHAGQFWVSTNNGVNFVNTGFTAALSADGLRVTLTTTGSAFPATSVRVEIHWFMPFGPAEVAAEGDNEVNLRGLLYDNQTYRGATNFAASARAGNVLEGTSRVGAGLAGVPVTVKAAASLVATERFAGSRTVTVRMMAADGVTVLREKALVITAS